MTPHEPPFPKSVACAFGKHTTCAGRLYDRGEPTRAVRRSRCVCECHQVGRGAPTPEQQPTLPGIGISREH
ncbi:MAG TPA: hypothetical protein VI855_06940 [Dehalococcoidia bacterium]|nr:hypothetical protein [Dehalococcoidia bacterium]